MSCLYPLTAWHKAGGGITFSGREGEPGVIPFNLPCGKCIECRLDYSLEWAMRCEHEAYSRPGIFVTLTYKEPLKNPRLDYADFQRFMNTLRKTRGEGIGFYVCGEYGKVNKRPHWHALIFGYQPPDCRPYRKNHEGDQLFYSDEVDRIWHENDPNLQPSAIGELTFKSAAYVARYSAKKLVHGHDGTHDFKPIAKMSRQYAIGKSFLESFHAEIFDSGFCMTFDGVRRPIPRYYRKWLLKHYPGRWREWLENIQLGQQSLGKERRLKELEEFWSQYRDLYKQGLLHSALHLQRPEDRKRELAKLKLERLNSHVG